MLVLRQQSLDLSSMAGLEIRLQIYIKLARSPRRISVSSYFFNSIYQSRTGQGAKWLVVGPVVAGGDEPGVFNLFVAPQHAQGQAMAGKQFLRQLAHAVHIKQGAVGVKQDGAGHGGNGGTVICHAPL